MCFISQYQSALKNKDFVEESICEVGKCGSIIEAEKPPDVINPLLVSINSSGKKCLVLDLKYVNIPMSTKAK